MRHTGTGMLTVQPRLVKMTYINEMHSPAYCTGLATHIRDKKDCTAYRCVGRLNSICTDRIHKLCTDDERTA